jgi:hypothetical protein
VNDRQRIAYESPCQRAVETADRRFHALVPSRRGLLLSSILTVNR